MERVTAPEQEWVQTKEMVQAHYSSLTLHRKCPQAWLYRYQYGLRRPIAGPAPELHFGSWWGALVGADSLVRGRKYGSLLVPPRTWEPIDKGGPKFDQATVTVVDVIAAAKDWWSKQDELTVETWNERLGSPLPRRLYDAYVRWRDEWADERKHERPLGLEMFWERALPRPSEDVAWEVNGDPVQFEGLPEIRLIGFIDEVYWDTAREMVVVRDNKSTKALAMQTALDDMMDSQLQLYAWGIQPTLDKLGAGQVRAVAYDRIRSSAPTQPKVTASGGLSAAVTNFDLKTYLDWAKGPDGEGVLWGEEGAYFVSGPRKGEPKFGRYTAEDKIIEKLSTPQWKGGFHQRQCVPVSRHIVRAHLRAAVDTATDIWRTEQRAKLTFEAARNLSKDNCKWCDYASICRAQMVGGPEGEYELAEHNLLGRDNARMLIAGAA